jgi:uncharacterized protein
MDPNRRAATATPNRPRRRASRRTYVVRRVLVLLVLAGFVGGLIVVVLAVVSDSDETAGSPTVSNNAGSTGSLVPNDPVQTTAVQTTVPETTTTGAPVVDTGRVPTAADPARVLIAGDSDAGSFGPYLQKLIGNTTVAQTTLDYKTSSGLARPDFFDWPAHFTEQLATIKPDIVIVTFGGNDGQSIHGMPNKVDSPEWRAEYGKRVAAAMEQLSAEGRTLIWVGIPNGPTDDFTARLKVQNEVVTAQAAAHPDVVLVDTWNRFSGIDGGYAEYVIDPRDGISKDVRAGDGFHLNTTGAEILALDINAAVTADLLERGWPGP